MPEDRAQPLSGEAFADALQTATRWLEQNAEAINALNVFPVPDGDTGLNMSLTLKSATESVQGAHPESVGQAVEAIARGALMGSRGNSGVILAHILRGIARELVGASSADGRTLARALKAGAENAYHEVPNPVEGTILTVARRAGEAAAEAAGRDNSVIGVLDVAHAAARLAVADTPNLLPILRQASVVDAGGEGYRIFLQGLLMHLRGEPLPASPTKVSAWADLSSLHQDAGDFYGYCTEVLFQGINLNVEATRGRVSELGTSVLVVGDQGMIKVHVHTGRPGAVLDLATELGELVRVKIDNMQLQHQQFAATAGRATLPRDPAQSISAEASDGVEAGTAVVAVASGEGMAELFRSLGASVISGGATMNPSVEQIAAAIRSAPGRDVIVLPNNKNVVLAAEQALDLVGDRVARVVPSRNMPQGIAALLALNPEAGAVANLQNLVDAADGCHAIEIAEATRDADIDGVTITAGQLVAMLDDRPAGASASRSAALEQALDQLGERSPNAAAVYVGLEGTEAGAHELAAVLRARFGLDPDVIQGGQPHYHYIVSVE